MSSSVNVAGFVGAAVGQKAMAAALPVVISSDQSAIPATQSGTWTVQQGTTGAGAAAPWSARLSDGAAFYQAALTGQFPAALVGGRLDVNIGATGVTQPVSGTVTANQGTANTAANRWAAYLTDGTNNMPTMDAAARRGFMSVTDGTNTSAVKAASTAAVATDPSLVVTFSPNTGLPTGANVIGAVTQSGAWTATANQGTAAGANGPWSVRLSDGTSFYNAPTTAQLPAALVGGRLDVVVGAALPTGANTIGAVTGPTADNAANPTLKLATLPARANAASPTWTEGNVAPLSVDLVGGLRTRGVYGTASISGTTNTATTWQTLGSTVTGLDAYDSLMIEAELIGDTGGTLDILIQTSPNGGTTWVDWVRFTQLAASAAAITRAITLSRGDSTGTAIVATSRTAVGGNAQSDLATGTVVQGDFGDRMRVLTLTGGTPAGAVLAFRLSGR